MTPYTMEEIRRLNLLIDPKMSLVYCKTDCYEAQVVAGLIPDNISLVWRECISWCIQHAKTLDKKSLENFINELPAGYLRMRTRDIQDGMED